MNRRVIVCLIFSLASLNGRETKIADQLHSYFIANYKHFAKEPEQALTWYQRTLTLESPVFANKGLIHLLHETSNDAIIIKLKPIINEHFKDDVDMQYILAKSESATGNEAAAHAILIHLNQKAKTNQEIAFHTAQIYLQRQEPENALNVIDSLLNNAVRKPNHFIFHFLKAQIYLQLNKKEEALASINKTLELHPRFEKGWLMRALLEEKLGKIEDAIKGYTNFLDLVGPNQEIEQHIIALGFKQKVQEHPHPQTPQTADILAPALMLFDQKKYAPALAAVEKIVADHPGNSEAKLLKIQLLVALDNIPQALSDLKIWASAEADHPLWFNTIHLLYRNGTDARRIIKTLHDIEKAAPEALLPALYLADMYLRTNGHQAITYLHRCLNNTDNKELQSALVFQLCALAYNQHNFKQLKQLYTTHQDLAKNNAPLLNLMSYYYASKEKNNVLAQELINQALALDAHNPHLQDTQALIWYKQQKYDAALSILEKIAQEEPNDYTIIKHLAKTYYQKGDIVQATRHMQRVLSLTQNGHQQKKYQQRLLSWTKQQPNQRVSAL